MLLDNLLVMGDGDKFDSHLRFTGTVKAIDPADFVGNVTFGKHRKWTSAHCEINFAGPNR